MATHVVHIQLLQRRNFHRCGHGYVYLSVIQQMAENLIQGPRLVSIQDERRGRWDWEGQSDDAIRRATKTTAPVLRMRTRRAIKERKLKVGSMLFIVVFWIFLWFSFWLTIITRRQTSNLLFGLTSLSYRVLYSRCHGDYTVDGCAVPPSQSVLHLYFFFYHFKRRRRSNPMELTGSSYKGDIKDDR